MSNQALTSENEIAEAVLRVLARSATGEASLVTLRKQVPKFLNLTEADLAESPTRPGEAMWEQRLRNIRSHHKTEGNYIAEGYLTAPSRGRLRITDAGRRKVGL